MRWSVLLLAMSAARLAAAAEIQVRLSGGLVDVQVTAAPLQDVLARLAQQTGMKVVYDGPPPRGLITVTLPQRTPAEAVLALFEGAGVNYAMRTDNSGARVDTLIVTSAGSATSARDRPGQAAPVANDPRRGQSPERAEEPEEIEKDEPEEKPKTPAPVPGAGAPVTFGGVVPGPGRPGSPFGNQMGPLTMPTPPPAPASPAPTPVPTPSPTPNPGTP